MIFDHIEESSDKLIIFYSQHLIDVLLCILENVVSDTFYCSTVCYGICTVQCDRLARSKCHCHTWRSSRLNTDHFNLWIQHFCKCRYTCNQSAAANWMTEDGQLWPMPREIWPHMLTSMAETPLSGFTAA